MLNIVTMTAGVLSEVAVDGSDTAIAVFAISEPEEETSNPTSGTICRLENYSVPCLVSMESMATVIRLTSVVSI